MIAIIGAISWQTATVANFYAHQDSIEQEHCVNKDKPELQCHGKCHLKAQLETNIENNQPESSRILANSLLVFQGYEELFDIIELASQKKNNSEFIYSFSLQTTTLSGVLDPPENC